MSRQHCALPVEEPVAVHVGQCLQDLENYRPDSRVGKRLGRLAHEPQQVPLDVLEDKVEPVVLPDHLLELDHVGVVQLLQGLHFTQVHHLKRQVRLDPCTIFPYTI